MRHLRRPTILMFAAVAITLAAAFHHTPAAAQTGNQIQTVFVIIFENHNWSEVLNNPAAPYINSLLGRASRAEAYFTPGGIHASTPNYLWLEAGTNFGINDSADPSAHHLATTNHLVIQLQPAFVQEQADSGTIRIGETVELGYVDQSRDSLHADKTIWEEISGGNDVIELGKRQVNSRHWGPGCFARALSQAQQAGIVTRAGRNTFALAGDGSGDRGVPFVTGDRQTSDRR